MVTSSEPAPAVTNWLGRLGVRPAGWLCPTSQSGSSMVMTALMLSVFFGMLALVVDFGQVMVHRRLQQNAADAAVMAAARLLASNVGVSSSGDVYYVDQDDAKVMTRAQQLASGNWLSSAVSRSLTLEYLDCSKALLRAAVAGSSTSIPVNTCYVRATGTSVLNTLFLRAADPTRTTATASATATARIAPTAAPQRTTMGTWPITRWLNHPQNYGTCPYTPGIDCVFWSDQGGSHDTSIGSWKEKLYLSRYSQYRCPSNVAQLIFAYDTARPGSHCADAATKQLDMEYWLRYSFGGTVAVGDKPEADATGSQGTNYATAMRDYIAAAPEGTRPGWGDYRTLQVILWEQAERYNSTSGTWQNWPASTSHPPDRIIISDIRCFRFYYNHVDSSAVRGHYLSCYGATPPTSGPPSPVANTVQMVD